MDLTLNEDMASLAELVRDLVPLQALGDNASAERHADQTWQLMARAGLLELPWTGGLPEDQRPVAIMVIATEIGRKLSQVPFIDSVLHAGGLIARLGTPEQRTRWLDPICAGTQAPVVAYIEGARQEASTSSTTATLSSVGWRVSGAKDPVLCVSSAEHLLTLASVAGRERVFVIRRDDPGVVERPYPTPYGVRRSRFEFNAADAEPLGDPTQAQTADIEAVRTQVSVAFSCEAVGIMESLLGMTTDYLRTRRQFGRPLSQFQALAHRAADLHVKLELARSMAMLATVKLSDSPAVATQYAARAKVQVGSAARTIGEEAIQMHGGIGLTSELSLPHGVARLLELDVILGSRDEAMRSLADQLSYESVDLLT